MIYSPGRGIWSGIEKSSKPERVRKRLVFTSACFWGAIAKVQFLKERLGTMSPPKFENFLIFP